MPLSWNEIKDRALKFSKEWSHETREHAEAKSFWDDFFNVFGISRRRVASFEEPVKKLNDHYGFIDLFWKGTLLIEHKSKGKDLGKAYSQALDYFSGLKEHELPKYVLVSDFERFRLFDLEEKDEHEFTISEFHKNVKLFGFIAGYQKRTFREEDPVNIKAAELLGKLHDQLEATGYEGHTLEVFLVRVLFCLFADDTGIFEKDIFNEYVQIKTNEDGSNLGAMLAQLFQVLNTPKEKRLKNLDESLALFPYVNGKLFEEPLPISAFNSRMRMILLECSALDWGKISPAIFGSMFQSVMNPEERRNLGAHYTSEKNIMKLIKPLFLDDLHEELQKASGSFKKLNDFHDKLASLKFLDPACGCGNFLIISYRELRLLELEILRQQHRTGQGFLDISQIMLVDVDQFYGIEIDEWPARIAEVAMWLMDHQMNMLVSEEFGQYFVRLPLSKSANIVNGNALRIDWEEVIPKTELNFILGNPPFVGKNFQTKQQKEEISLVYGIKKVANADYVTCWFIKAAGYIQETSIQAAFVSTNSITQGEQVSIIWKELFEKYKVKINFAHKTFQWNNEARNKAAVHVVIIGFGFVEKSQKRIFSYDNIKGEPHEAFAKNINPYLIEGKDIFLAPITSPVCNVPKMVNGNKVVDGGNLILTIEEKERYLKNEPLGLKFIKLFIGSEEYINKKERWCFWLKDANPSEIRKLPILLERIKAVQQMRLESKDKNTNKWASKPMLFMAERQPSSDYLLIPRVSSENREYIPVGYLSKDIIISDRATALPEASLFLFGVITSKMHMTWTKYTCGRMKSDYNYSNSIVYNNYPWPKNPSEKNNKQVEEKAQKVLDVREEFPESSLADLYDPLTMPPKLAKAHQQLDRAVDLCYRPQPFPNETARIEYLFDLYSAYTQPLLK